MKISIAPGYDLSEMSCALNLKSPLAPDTQTTAQMPVFTFKHNVRSNLIMMAFQMFWPVAALWVHFNKASPIL